MQEVFLEDFIICQFHYIFNFLLFILVDNISFVSEATFKWTLVPSSHPTLLQVFVTLTTPFTHIQSLSRHKYTHMSLPIPLNSSSNYPFYKFLFKVNVLEQRTHNDYVLLTLQSLLRTLLHILPFFPLFNPFWLKCNVRKD